MSKVKVNVKKKVSDEFEVNGVKLRAYPSGKIERWVEIRNQYYPNLGWQHVEGSIRKDGYLSCGLNGKYYLLHRLAYKAFNPSWNLTDTTTNNSIDHINGQKADNRLGNLREATNSQNQMNRPVYSNNQSGEKCIIPENYRKKNYWSWTVEVMVNGKRTRKRFRAGPGAYPTPLPPVPQHIIDYRDQLLQSLHGEFANF